METQNVNNKEKFEKSLTLNDSILTLVIGGSGPGFIELLPPPICVVLDTPVIKTTK